MSFNYLIKQPKTQVDKPVMLLMLHGYGSNKEDLFSFAHDLPDELLIISAEAPINMGFGGYAWYPIHFDTDQNKFTDIPAAIKVRDALVQFIDAMQEKYHFDTKKSMLMGFSQGAILSYALALTYPERINNIIALSGYFLEEICELDDVKEKYENLKIFASHGTVDPVIPIQWARETQEKLNRLNIDLVYKEYPVGHGVSPDNFTDFKTWILDRIK
jgi:phospholipase/carboxylesterase